MMTPTRLPLKVAARGAVAAVALLAAGATTVSWPRISTAGTVAQRIGDFALGAPKSFTVNLRPGATRADAQLVAAYFRRFGLSVDDRNRQVLFVRGTYARAAAAASTGFEVRRLGGDRYVHTSRPPAFPRAVASRVLATTLDDGPPLHAGRAEPDLTLLPKYGYTPAGLATYYDAASLYAAGTNGAGQNLAIVDCGGPDTTSTAYFESQFGLPSNTPAIVYVDAPPSTPSSIFATIDFDQVDAVAPGATITMYIMPSGCTFAQFADTFAAIAADMPSKHYVAVSDEYSGSEDYFDASGMDGTLTAMHDDIQNIAAAGATIFSDTGLWGAGPSPSEALGAGEITVEFPASDPNVVGVGGTSAIPKPGSTFTRAFEPAWGGSGGGVSHEFTIPSYQTGVSGIASSTNRNVPDVAYDADNNLCAEYFYRFPRQRFQTPFCTAGTGTGTDSWTGFIALLDQARSKAGKGALTNVEMHLYASAKSSGNFVKVTKGCNDYYCASVKEYDNVTGLGVPDVEKIVSTLTALP